MEIIKGKVDWIDITKPTHEDLEWLRKKYKIHKIILKELQEPSVRAKVESYDNYLFFIYYFPIYNAHEKLSRRAEIDFLILKNVVITVHYEDIPVLDHFRKVNFENTLELAYEMLRSLLVFEDRQLRHVRDKVEEISATLFEGEEREVLQNISYLKRDVSEYRIIIRHQRPILESLVPHGERFWGKEAKIYLNDILGEYLKILNQVEDYRETIMDFDNTNNQMMNVKSTEVMKTFTILAFLTFPLMLFTSLFAMRVPGVPFINRTNGFWIVIGILSTIMAVMLVYFKKRDWL